MASPLVTSNSRDLVKPFSFTALIPSSENSLKILPTKGTFDKLAAIAGEAYAPPKSTALKTNILVIIHIVRLITKVLLPLRIAELTTLSALSGI